MKPANTDTDSTGKVNSENAAVEKEMVEKIEIKQELNEVKSNFLESIIKNEYDDDLDLEDEHIKDENEKNDLKLQCDQGCENVIPEKILPNEDLKMYTFSKGDEEQEQPMETKNDIHGKFKCSLCSVKFSSRRGLCNHLLKIHKHKNNSKVSIGTVGRNRNSQKHKCQQCPYKTRYKSILDRHMKSHENIKNFQCHLCSKGFICKANLNNHLLRIHKSKDNITSKIYECDKCDYASTNNLNFLQHNLKHGIKDESLILKCEQCTFETYCKSDLVKHMKIYKNIRDFKCTYCSKGFHGKKVLDNHLLTIHKCRDNITSKVYECGNCSYATITKSAMLHHNFKHGIKMEGLKKFKCRQCSYETYHKGYLVKHMRRHKNIPDLKSDVLNDVKVEMYKCPRCTFQTSKKCVLTGHMYRHQNIPEYKCVYCSRKFNYKISLDYHLLRIHKTRDSITSKIFDCDICSYATTKRNEMLQHTSNHGIKVEGFKKLKCQHCTYETFLKTNFNKHRKKHMAKGIRQSFKCSYCSKEFNYRISLDKHLLSTHQCKDNITSNVYECHLCNYASIKRSDILQHTNLKHGIKLEGFETYKCQQCAYETYDKRKLNNHLERHKDIRNFKCTYCTKEFKCKASLDKHLVSVHKCKDNITTKLLECEHCSFITPKKNVMLQHKLKHGIKEESLQKYNCQECSYETYRKGDLSRHMSRHKDTPDVICSYCSKKFSHKNSLHRHVMNFHNCDKQ